MTACIGGNSTEMVLICLYVGLPKHVLHGLSLLKYRVRRAFLHKMRPDAMQKNGNYTSEPCDKAGDAKCSFRKGTINEKYTFFQWILQISRCNKWCKKGAYRHNWRAFVPLSKSLFPPRTACNFSQNEVKRDAKIQNFHRKAMR